MTAASSADRTDLPLPAFALPAGRRLAMVALGYIPLLHAGAVTAALVLPLGGLWPRWAWALAPLTLFLLPPLVVRLALLVRPLASASIELGSGAFLLWWFTAQWQAIFNRLGFLEELLRLVPGLYGAWLRLWGARVGRLVYFSPECRVVDRPFVVLGHRVLLSIGARLSPHLVSRGQDGVARLLLAPIEIGDGAMIGGHSWLGPGVFVAPGEMTPAVYALPAFSRFEGGKRTHHHPTLI